MMSQREAVFMAVTAVKGEINGVVSLDDSEKKQVHALVLSSFLNGEVSLKNAEQRDAEWLRKYIPGLVNNWVRKDPELNGHTIYKSKNPGSRPGDEQLKAMKTLLAAVTDASQKAIIQEAIEARTAELAAAKVTTTIDVAKLPEALRAFVPPTIRKA